MSSLTGPRTSDFIPSSSRGGALMLSCTTKELPVDVAGRNGAEVVGGKNKLLNSGSAKTSIIASFTDTTMLADNEFGTNSAASLAVARQEGPSIGSNTAGSDSDTGTRIKRLFIPHCANYTFVILNKGSDTSQLSVRYFKISRFYK